jgi:hypothetical protein
MLIFKKWFNINRDAMKYRLFALSMILALMLLPIGCKDAIENADLSDIVFPSSNVRYGEHVDPLFRRGCAYSGCHDSQTMADDLSLENYQDAISSKSGVIYLDRDTAQSRLLWRIEGKYALAQMPLGRAPLNSNQINGLKKWIQEGAQNN